MDAKTLILQPRRAASFLRDNPHRLVNILEAYGYEGQVSFSPGFVRESIGVGGGLASECISISYPHHINRWCAKALAVALRPNLSLVLEGNPETCASILNEEESLFLEDAILEDLSGRFEDSDLDARGLSHPMGPPLRPSNAAINNDGKGGDSDGEEVDDDDPIIWPRFSRTCIIEANAKVGEFKFSSSCRLQIKGDQVNTPNPALDSTLMVPGEKDLIKIGLPWVFSWIQGLQQRAEEQIEDDPPEPGSCCNSFQEGFSSIKITLPRRLWGSSESWSLYEFSRRCPFIYHDSPPYYSQDIPWVFHETKIDILHTGTQSEVDGREWGYQPTFVNQNWKNHPHGFCPPDIHTPWIIHTRRPFIDSEMSLESILAESPFSLRLLTTWTLDPQGLVQEGTVNKGNVVTFVQVVLFAAKLSQFPTRRSQSYSGSLAASDNLASTTLRQPEVDSEGFLNCDVGRGYLFAKDERTYTDSLSYKAVVVQLKPTFLWRSLNRIVKSIKEHV